MFFYYHTPGFTTAGRAAGRRREIGTGNLDYQVEIASKDEFGSMASSFNETVGEINRLYGQKVEQEKP